MKFIFILYFFFTYNCCKRVVRKSAENSARQDSNLYFQLRRLLFYPVKLRATPHFHYGRGFGPGPLNISINPLSPKSKWKSFYHNWHKPVINPTQLTALTVVNAFAFYKQRKLI